uniref:Uncharacterized protein n=1 Tax=Rhizophora mucronata TaxID=61149 RepID=A0A2P2QXU3_RHIMU
MKKPKLKQWKKKLNQKEMRLEKRRKQRKLKSRLVMVPRRKKGRKKQIRR